MDDNIDDLTFADSPAAARRAVKQGRRAAVDGEEDNDDFSGSPLKNRPKTGDILLLEEGPRRPRASAPARRSGQGWGEETRARTARSIRPMTAASVRNEESDDEPMIPDLEEVEQEDFALKVADAPNMAVNRVATYKELDNDLFKHAAFATLEEIDLKLLTQCLETEASLKEPDDPWHFDTLFTEMASIMQAEWMPEPEEKTTTTKERPYTAFNRFPV